MHLRFGRLALLPLALPLAMAFVALPAMAATSEASKACTAQADAKDLHGDARAKFRDDCMKAAAPAPAKAAAAPKAAAPKAAAAPKTPAAPKAAAAPAAKPAAGGSDLSKSCTAQADARDLHGDPRAKFRDTCMKGGAPAAVAKPPKPLPVPMASSQPTRITPPASDKPGTSDLSKSCTAQADARDLHGDPRAKFRDACMKGGAPAVAAAKPAAAPKPAPAKPAPMAAAPAPAAAAGKAAPSAQSAACSSQADAKGLHGDAREKFRSSCMKGAAPAVAVAKPVPAAKPAATAAAPMARPAAVAPVPAVASPGKPLSPAQEAANARIRNCGDQWKAAKAANRIPAGQTWPEYWSDCSKRMKR